MVYLYKLSGLYAGFLKLLGYERGISRFVDRLPLDCPKNLRLLDVGCGSGVVGLQFLERFPSATLLATDLEPNFLKATLANARSRGIDEKRITVALSDVATPNRITMLDGSVSVLDDASFDIVSVGGVLGYSRDMPESLRSLLHLIRPGGYLVNLEMSESAAGKFVATTYKCRSIPIRLMREQIEEHGHRVSIVPFTMANFPANLTRVGIVAKVSARKDLVNSATAPAEAEAQAAPAYKSHRDFDFST